MKIAQLHLPIYLIFFFQLMTFHLHSQKIQEYTPIDIADINSEEFGQGAAIGFGFLSDGLAFIVRKTLKSEDQIGLGTSIYLGTELDASGQSIERFFPGAFFRPEYNFHLANTYKEKAKRTYVKQKFRKHYISAKAGYGFSNLNIYSFALTWHRETFLLKNKNHSRGLDLGVSYTVLTDNNSDALGVGAGIYLRLDWTWFRQKNK